VVGKAPIDGIVLDASYYPSDLRIPGIEDTALMITEYTSLSSYIYIRRP
jgi:hypothetical protein